tara:strand:- start:1061 stop:1561 length:501 start_codon:yes stop_codon:yes gene_type:complete
MNSKQTVNKIFSKLNEKTNLATQKVELSLATDIDKAYKKGSQIEADLKFAAEKYKQIAMDQSDLWEEMMDAEIEKNKAEAKHAELKEDLESFSKNAEMREVDYRNSLQDANQLLKELRSLESKATKATKELGISEQQFPPLVTVVVATQDLEQVIAQSKSITQGIG